MAYRSHLCDLEHTDKLVNMIRRFESSDQETILNFAYQREKENMFIIGSFTAYPEPFSQNVYLGCYRNGTLIGIGTHFEKRFGSLVIHSQDIDALHELVDAFVKQGATVEWVPCFKRYGLPIVERLRTHGIEPKKVREETVFLLTRETFQDFSSNETEKAMEEDIEEIIRLDRVVESEDVNAPITERDRKQVIIGNEWILRRNGAIVSKANIHGISKNYVQIGGVMTHPEHQGKGYAKQTVSALSKYWLAQGKEILLFARNDNVPANKVYASLGFKPIDEFIVAAY